MLCHHSAPRVVSCLKLCLHRYRYISQTPYRYSFGKLLNTLPQPRKIQDVYLAAVHHFKRHGTPEAHISARYLLSKVAGVGYSPSDFSNAAKRELSAYEVELFASHVERRTVREPVQYILGDWDFYGLTFLIRAPVLVPRPETEELVELVLESLSDRNRPWRILDIGSGSGVLGISLLTHLPYASCTAIDLDPAAVALSKDNAIRLLPPTSTQALFREPPSHSARYTLLQCSIQELASRPDMLRSFDLIVSNPPYIPSDELVSLEPEVIEYESDLALHGGRDGLDVIRDILRLTPALLSDNCGDDGDSEGGVLWMEVSHTHPRLIENIVRSGDLSSSGADQDIGHGESDWNDGENASSSSSSSSSSSCGAGGPHFEFTASSDDVYGQPRFVRLTVKGSRVNE